jgi:hypothetical protein
MVRSALAALTGKKTITVLHHCVPQEFSFWGHPIKFGTAHENFEFGQSGYASLHYAKFVGSNTRMYTRMLLSALAAYLADAAGPVNLVMDLRLRIAHEHWGSSSNPMLNGKLHHPKIVCRLDTPLVICIQEQVWSPSSKNVCQIYISVYIPFLYIFLYIFHFYIYS